MTPTVEVPARPRMAPPIAQPVVAHLEGLFSVAKPYAPQSSMLCLRQTSSTGRIEEAEWVMSARARIFRWNLKPHTHLELTVTLRRCPRSLCRRPGRCHAVAISKWRH